MTAENEAKLIRQLKRHEGFRVFVYADTKGILTVGWGHAFQGQDAVGIVKGDSFKMERLEEFFQEDFQRAMDLYPNLEIDNLDEVRQAVLINMLFNMGLGSAKTGRGLLGFKNTLAAIRAGDYIKAAKGMLKSKWAGQVKGRADELAAQMRTGQWQK